MRRLLIASLVGTTLTWASMREQEQLPPLEDSPSATPASSVDQAAEPDPASPSKTKPPIEPFYPRAEPRKPARKEVPMGKAVPFDRADEFAEPAPKAPSATPAPATGHGEPRVERGIPVPREDRAGHEITFAGADRYHQWRIQQVQLTPADLERERVQHLTRFELYRNMAGFTPNQLLLERKQTGAVDRCSVIRPQHNFLNAIQGAVETAMVDRLIETDSDVTGPYKMTPMRDPRTGKIDPRTAKVSLLSNKLCDQSTDDVAKMLGHPKTMPDPAALEILHKFSTESNRLRQQALANIPGAKDNFANHWTQFMSCLAYEESLQTTGEPGLDAEKSNATGFAGMMAEYPSEQNYFRPNPHSDPERPPGVQFGNDRRGKFYSKINEFKAAIIAAETARRGARFASDQEAEDFAKPKVDEYTKSIIKDFPKWRVEGLYQFDPHSGNVESCRLQWNAINPDCAFGPGEAKRMTALGSSGQTFNAFCGAQKVVQSFNSQVNTSSDLGTDNHNLVNGVPTDARGERCVSILGIPGNGRVYNHFGPLGDSVSGNNFPKLMHCVEFATNLRDKPSHPR